MSNWFIMAAGKADRCGGKCKQMFKINGERLVDRTVRLINEIDCGAYIYLVGSNPLLEEIKGVEMIYIKGTTCLAQSIYSTSHKWSDSNCVIMGDVVTDEELIRSLYLYQGKPVCFGKLRCLKHGKYERYALKFGADSGVRVLDGLYNCIGHPQQNEVPCCITSKLWMWISTLHDMGGLIGWIYWRWLHYGVLRSVNMIEVPDDRVCDIDTIEELFTYGSNYGCRVSTEGS